MWVTTVSPPPAAHILSCLASRPGRTTILSSLATLSRLSRCLNATLGRVCSGLLSKIPPSRGRNRFVTFWCHRIKDLARYSEKGKDLCYEWQTGRSFEKRIHRHQTGEEFTVCY